MWGERVIIGAILAAVWAVAGAELLSLVKWLSFWPLLIWWLAPVLCLLALLVRRKLHAPHYALHAPRDPVLTAICAASAVILGITFLVAVVTPPNNLDALNYHLPRQFYWMQQKHVGFYPTIDLRQIVMPPLAEYIGAQVMILSGGDRWLNLIQWAALGLSALTASAIARTFGRNARLQALAALFVVTIPVAALEAVNTKNDVLSGFFALAAAFFALKYYSCLPSASSIPGSARSQPSIRPILCLLFGASVGLVILTKSSGLLFAIPVAMWMGILSLRSVSWPQAAVSGVLIAAMALAINAGHFVRVYNEFGSPVWVPKLEDLQTSPELTANADRVQARVIKWTTLVNRDRSPKGFLSNVIRNTTMHLGTWSPAMNGALERGVASVHEWLGVDVNDPATTYSAASKFQIRPQLKNEGAAKAPIHVLLGLFALALILSGIRKSDFWVSSFLFMPYAGFLLFCYSVAWQQWHPRLHIPALFLLCPVIVYSMRMRFEKVLYPAAVLALVLTLYSVAFNSIKPIVGKSSIFAKSREELRLTPQHTKDSLQQIRLIHSTLKPKVLGIRTAGYEYLLQAALLDSPVPPPILVQLEPQFVPRRGWSMTQAPPDLLISWRSDRPPTIKFGAEHEYLLVDESDDLGIYLPPNQSLPPALSLKRRSAFASWCALENIDRPEGPYPEWDLPMVRWGLGPASRLQFLSDGAMKRLILNCRRNNHTNQQMAVEVNGASLTNLAFGAAFEFKEWILPIQTVPGTNVVAIRYASWDKNDPARPLAVLYKELRIE